MGLVAAAAPAAAQAVPSLPFASGSIYFHVGVLRAPSFTGHVVVDSAAYTGDSLAAVRGAVVVRVAGMHTGIGLRDGHLRDVMDARRYPVIRFALDSVVPGLAGPDSASPAGPGAGRPAAARATAGSDSLAVTFYGALTIRGVTRPVAALGSAALDSGLVDVAATFRLDMRDYGVKPPTALFGLIKVRPVVELGVALRFGGPAPAAETKAGHRRSRS